MRLMLVEDEPTLGGLLVDALQKAGFGVDLAPDLALARDYIRVANYDIAVLDRGLADGDGLDLVRELRRLGNTLPILVLTARDAPRDRVAGLDTGADDYLIKPFHIDELLSRIRALLRRPNAALGVELTFGRLTLHTTTRVVTVAENVVSLSVRETSLLELLLRRSGTVVARESIEESLYSFDTVTTPNALEVLVHRLRRRLGDTDAGVTIHTIRGVGYLLALA